MIYAHPRLLIPLLVEEHTRNLAANIHARHNLPHLSSLHIPPHDHDALIVLQPHRYEVAGLVEREVAGSQAAGGGLLDEGQLASVADGECDEGVGGDVALFRVGGVRD